MRSRVIGLMGCRLVPVLILAGCAQVPISPSVQVMPGRGKSYAVFQGDQMTCSTLAQQQTRGHVDASNNRAAGIVALSALAGAAQSRAYGERASIGATEGGLAGAQIAGEMGANDQYSIQRLFDATYGQCMYARGHQVDGYAPVVAARTGPDPALVRAVQNELQRLGFLSGPVDGQFGGMTSGAIKQFEQANGMAVSGYPTQRLLARLQNNSSGNAGAGSASGAGTASGASSSNWVSPVSSAQRTGAPAAGPEQGTTGTTSGASGWVTPAR